MPRSSLSPWRGKVGEGLKKEEKRKKKILYFISLVSKHAASFSWTSRCSKFSSTTDHLDAKTRSPEFHHTIWWLLQLLVSRHICMCRNLTCMEGGLGKSICSPKRTWEKSCSFASEHVGKDQTFWNNVLWIHKSKSCLAPVTANMFDADYRRILRKRIL